MKYIQHLPQSNQRAKGSRVESLQKNCPNLSCIKCSSTFLIWSKQSSLTAAWFHLCKYHCSWQPGFCVQIEVPCQPLAWKEMWWVGADRLSLWHFHWGAWAWWHVVCWNRTPMQFFLPLLFKAETFILNSQPHKSLRFVAGLLKPRMPVRLASHVSIKA